MKSIRSTALLLIVAICLILTAVNYITLRTTSAVRAYVNGESLYSKGQKDASNHLVLYLLTQDSIFWDRFNTSIQIPLGDKLAREALEVYEDEDLIKKYFIQGKNHPDDLEDMIWFFHTFSQVKFLQESALLWKNADQLNQELLSLGGDIHEMIQNQTLTPDKNKQLLTQINLLSEQLSIIESEFSSRLGAIARTLNRLVFIINVLLIIAIIGMSGYYAIQTLKKMSSAKKLRDNLMNAAHDAAVWYDENSVISFWNPQAEKTFGWTREEIIGKKLTETIIPPEHVPTHLAGIKNYLTSGESPLKEPRQETVALRKDGSTIPVQMSILSLREGSKTIFSAHLIDMSNRRQLEIEKEEKTSYLKAILESTDDGILATNDKGEILEANQRFADLWNIPLERTRTTDLGRVAQFMMHQIYDAEEIIEEVKMLLKSNKIHTRLVYSKDGRIFERHSVPMILDHEIVGRVWSFRDITDKIKAESDYKNLFEHSAEGIYIADLDGKFLNINPAMAAMHGYKSPKEMIREVTDPSQQLLVDAEDLPAIQHILRKKGKATAIEYRTRKKNGDIFWVRNHLRVVLDKNGKPYQIEGSVEDISARKEAQDQLLQQIEELKKVNFELDRFVYSVSHDLRAPLLSIKGLVNISEMENPSSEVLKYLNLIKVSVDRLDKFIMDILDYSRNSRLELQLVELDCEQIIAELLNNMSHIFGFQELNINYDVRLAQPLVSDRRRIEVILSNLISNAIKYQDETKTDRYINITVTDGEERDHVSIAVADNGIGIAHESREKIFDMFYRDSDLSKGAGLGLYIIKETISKLGGQIKLESVPNQYTTFTILLPTKDPLAQVI